MMVDQASIDLRAVLVRRRRNPHFHSFLLNDAAGDACEASPSRVTRASVLDSVGVRAFFLGLALLAFVVLMDLMSAGNSVPTQESLSLLSGSAND